MDIWAVLSLIADAASRLWGEAAGLIAPLPEQYLIAGALLAVALVLLALAGVRGPQPKDGPGRETRREPRRAPRTLTADEAFSSYAGARPTDARAQPTDDFRFLEKLRDSFDGGPTLDVGPTLDAGPTLDVGPARPAFAAPPQPAVPESARDVIARLEAQRGSRVIAIIHRENMEHEYLDVVDLEDALTAIRKTPKDKPLDVIVHSPGGSIRVGQQIARAIHAHPARTTVFVPYFALGSSTFMAFAADEIVMSAHAALSPVDPFVGVGPASSVLKGIQGKPIEKVKDETVIYADVARKLLSEARRVTCELMHDGQDHDGTCRMADELVSGKWSRDRAITFDAARELGLTVSLRMPGEVYELIRSCRRNGGHETSVTYLDHGGDDMRAPLKDRSRHAPPIGIYDSSVRDLVEWAKAPAARPAASRTVWLAHSGGHVPEASLDRARAIIRHIEEKRGSHVICVIHGENMENDSFDFDDLEDVLSALVASDPSRPLDIVLHTQGGNSFTGRQIARAVKSHPARKTVFVPYFAMSAGSRIALAADQIVMGAHATMGPIDTQLYGWPAPSILQLVKTKPIGAISDEFLVLAEEARKVMVEGRASACELLKGTYSHDGSCAIADELIGGKWTHGFPITAEAARGLGLNVSTNLPDVFYDLVRCFRHADGEDPSVLFIPR